MAVRFEVNDDVIRLTQTRRGLRLTFAVIAVVLALDLGLLLVLGGSRFETTLACSHATGACTLTKGKAAHELPLASISSVTLGTSSDGTASWVWLKETRAHELCGATDADGRAAAAAFAQAASAFLQDAARPPIELHCTSQSVNGPGFKGLFAALLGWLLVGLLFAPLSTEVSVVIDKRAGTVHSKGRAWFRRAWDVTKPISEVVRVALNSRYAGRGNRQYLVVAYFRDDTEALLWSPAATTMTTLTERFETLRAALAPGRD